MLFGGGSIAIGGEWFQMWQSSRWEQPTVTDFLIESVGLILTHLGKSAARIGSESDE
jgi:predicted small integral membrane protein